MPTFVLFGPCLGHIRLPLAHYPCLVKVLKFNMIPMMSHARRRILYLNLHILDLELYHICKWGRSRFKRIKILRSFASDYVQSDSSVEVPLILPHVMQNAVLVFQGPIVQSIVSLTSLLRGQLVKCFTTL